MTNMDSGVSVETEDGIPAGVMCPDCTLCGTSEPPATIESEGDKDPVLPLTKVECPYCGASIDDDYIVCPYCCGNLNPSVPPMLGVPPIE